MPGYTEYDFGTAVVRIHPGKRTEEQRKEALTYAAQKFYRNVHARRNAGNGGNGGGGNGITARFGGQSAASAL